jgi:hypothetical protein
MLVEKETRKYAGMLPSVRVAMQGSWYLGREWRVCGNLENVYNHIIELDDDFTSLP